MKRNDWKQKERTQGSIQACQEELLQQTGIHSEELFKLENRGIQR